MALMLGALTLQGIAAGPQVMLEKPDLFWGLIASMWIGNCLLVVLNLPLVGIWVKLLTVPYRWLFPSIILFCCIGNFSVNNNPFDVYLCALIGVLGYVLVKRAGAAPPRLRAGAAAGGEPAAGAADRARRPDRLFYPPDQPGVHDRDLAYTCRHGRARRARDAPPVIDREEEPLCRIRSSRACSHSPCFSGRCTPRSRRRPTP
jgi:hypothetical protein